MLKKRNLCLNPEADNKINKVCYCKECVSKRVSPEIKAIVKRGIEKYRSALEKLAKE